MAGYAGGYAILDQNLLDQVNLESRPHTHGTQDIPGLQGFLDRFGLGASRPTPHTHNYTDLVGTQLLLPTGTVAIPSYSFTDQKGTGLSRSTNRLSFSVNGFSMMSVTSLGILDLQQDTCQLRFGGNSDTNLSRAAAGQLQLLGTGTDTKMIVKAGSSQTANLQEWQNSSGTALSAIDKDGSFTGTIQPMQVAGPPKPHTHNYTDLVGAQLLVPDGTAAAPSIAFASDTNTGLYRAGADQIYMVAGGTARVSIVGGSYTVISTPLVLSQNGNAWLTSDAADTLAQRNGTNAQVFRLYNTFTDASNYERMRFSWESNTLIIGTEAAGSGSQRPVSIRSGTGVHIYLRNGVSTDFYTYPVLPGVDATLDLGSAANRWRSILLGGAAAVVPITVKAHASQTANLTEWQNSSGTVLSRIDKDGQTTDFVLAGQIFGN